MNYERALTALADPTRRRLLARLRRRPHDVGELTRHAGISQPAVSQHLRVLRRPGLVRRRALGTRRLYEPDLAGLAAIRDYLDRMWDDVLAAYAGSFERGRR
jgi:DNA-binding transcriptional ArsR family regulator